MDLLDGKFENSLTLCPFFFFLEVCDMAEWNQ